MQVKAREVAIIPLLKLENDPMRYDWSFIDARYIADAMSGEVIELGQAFGIKYFGASIPFVVRGITIRESIWNGKAEVMKSTVFKIITEQEQTKADKKYAEETRQQYGSAAKIPAFPRDYEEIMRMKVEEREKEKGRKKK